MYKQAFIAGYMCKEGSDFTKRPKPETRVQIVETQDPGTEGPHTRYDANMNGKNVGFVLVASPTEKDPPGEMAFRALYVSPEYRGLGVASKLMIHALKANRGRRVALKPSPYEEIEGKKPPKSLEELRAMYAHFGFKKSPTRPKLVTQKVARLNYKTIHGHGKKPAGSVCWYFHNFATHGENMGYNHCEGGPANPYQIKHATKDGTLGHVINKSYARGHGYSNKPQWWRFTRKLDNGYDLSSGEKVDVADVPKRFK